jgi:phage shock protein PspC (stress-responsive transcriptional regulator)
VDVTFSSSLHQRNKKEMETNKRLYRDSQNKLIGGVCSGLGAYFNVDFSIIRIIWLLLFPFWRDWTAGLHYSLDSDT